MSEACLAREFGIPRALTFTAPIQGAHARAGDPWNRYR